MLKFEETQNCVLQKMNDMVFNWLFITLDFVFPLFYQATYNNEACMKVFFKLCFSVMQFCYTFLILENLVLYYLRGSCASWVTLFWKNF